jgi:hypothetical protein
MHAAANHPNRLVMAHPCSEPMETGGTITTAARRAKPNRKRRETMLDCRNGANVQ